MWPVVLGICFFVEPDLTESTALEIPLFDPGKVF